MNDQNAMSAMQRTITVLGMHRSGTSALMGSLQEAGVYISRAIEYSEDNLKGNRESLSIMTLHDDLLSRSGGAWDNPVGKITWEPVHRALVSEIINGYSSQACWGFKDPRTLFFAAMWLKLIPHLEMIGIFRHPALVADSLARRDNKPVEDSLQLWFHYNMNLKWLLVNKGPIPVVEFSHDAADFQSQVRALTQTLSLKSADNSFFDDKLRHTTVPTLTDSQISRRCLKLYRDLQVQNIAWRERVGLPVAKAS